MAVRVRNPNLQNVIFNSNNKISNCKHESINYSDTMTKYANISNETKARIHFKLY